MPREMLQKLYINRGEFIKKKVCCSTKWKSWFLWWSLSSQIFLTLKQKNHMSWPFCPYYIQYDPNIEKSALLSCCCCCYFTQCKKNWCIFSSHWFLFFSDPSFSSKTTLWAVMEFLVSWCINERHFFSIIHTQVTIGSI